MPQVPFPTNIATPVRLVPPDRAPLVGRLVLALSILAALGAGAVTAVRSGRLDRFQSTPTDAPAQTGTVAGASVSVRDRVLDDLATFTVQPEDLPTVVVAYRQSPNEGGSADDILSSEEILSSVRTTYASADPLDVFSSSVFLFATRAQALRTFYRHASADGLSTLVGQPVSVSGSADRGQDSVVFRESSAVPDAERVFAGVLLVNDRTVALAFGFFPASIGQRDFQQLVTPGLDRYRRVVPGVRKTPTQDRDADALPDGVEEVLGTDPDARDSDQDGFLDRQELESSYDPLGAGKQGNATDLFSIPGLTP